MAGEPLTLSGWLLQLAEALDALARAFDKYRHRHAGTDQAAESMRNGAEGARLIAKRIDTLTEQTEALIVERDELRALAARRLDALHDVRNAFYDGQTTSLEYSDLLDEVVRQHPKRNENTQRIGNPAENAEGRLSGRPSEVTDSPSLSHEQR